MKKTFLLAIIAMLFMTGHVMSQKQLYFGLAGTALSSGIINQNNYGLPFEMDYAVTTGGSGNVNVGFDFNKHAGLKLEIGWAKLGQKYKDLYRDTVYTRNIKLNYLQIPLMFKYRTGGSVAKFYFMVGPQFNFLLSATQVYLKGNNAYNDTVPLTWNLPTKIGESTITNRYKSFDILGRLDLGVDIMLGKSLFLNLGLSFAYGFTDINATDWQIKDHTGNYNPSHNAYGGFNVGINYVLPVGGK